MKFLGNNGPQNVDLIEEVDENEYSKLEYAKALLNPKKTTQPSGAKKEQLIHEPKIGTKLRHRPAGQQNTYSKESTSKSKEEIPVKKAASPVKIIANKTPKTPVKPPALTPKKSISSVKSIEKPKAESPISPKKTSIVTHLP